MFKFTVFICVLLIGSLHALSSCDSCGVECIQSCGTRRFRPCCFNYLRKKRGPDTEMWSLENEDFPAIAVFLKTNEDWNDIDIASNPKLSPHNDKVENRLNSVLN